MKRKFKELKRMARDFLNNRYHIPSSAFITAALIPAAIEIPFSLCIGDYPTNEQKYITLAAEYLILLIGYVLNAGTVQIHLNLTRSKPFTFSQMFTPFRTGTDRYLGAALLLSLLSIIASLPFVLASVCMSVIGVNAISLILFMVGIMGTALLMLRLLLNYQFVPYFLLDYPEMRVMEAFRCCKKMLYGKKNRVFFLLCSFLGYVLLILLSFGFAALWVVPYMTETLTIFYLDCTGELDRLPERDYSKENLPV